MGSAPALAIPQRGHVLSFAFGSKGKGTGQFSAPGGVAVNDLTGALYVADRKNKRVQEFMPVFNKAGMLVEEEYVREWEVASPQSVAVDNSTEGADPSQGDVYVVHGGKTIEKFSSEGAQIGEPLKKFAPKSGAAQKFEAIEGVAVDSTGSLFVYQEDGKIYRFSDAVANEAESSLQAELAQKGKPGFAVDPAGNFYVGVQSEGQEALEREKEEGRTELPVVAKLAGATGSVLLPELDSQDTTAVAVNPAYVPANLVDERGDVYVTNEVSAAGKTVTTISEFGPDGGLIQSFGAAGLSEGDGIAVDAQTGTLYVADAASNKVDVFGLEPAGPPTVDGLTAQSLPVTPPVSNATKLAAQVNPRGADTHYYFEYGSASCAATPSLCTRAPTADAGAGFGDQSESLELQDLPPGSYHYRVVAESSFGAVQSPEHTFTVLSLLSGLPDGRAWEMVSPPDKIGAPIEPLTREGGVILAGENGDAITYVTQGAIAEEAPGNRTPELQQVLATRGSKGWNSQDIVTPSTKAQGVTAGQTPEYQYFSSDLSLALVQPFGTTAKAEPPLAPEVTQRTMYIRDDTTGTYLPLVTEANVPPGTEFGQQIHFVAATPDLSHVVLASTVALTGAPSGPGLYEWSGGKLRFVSLLPAGTPAPSAALGYLDVHAHAISTDGTRVIWTDIAGGTGHLYMRDTATGETIQLDAAQGVSEPPEGSAEFQTASGDGSKVLFTDKQRLTPDSTAEAGQGVGKADLYECEVGEQAGKPVCHLRDLTVDQHAGEHASVQGLLFGAGEDGSDVYFVARGVLAANENGNGEAAQAGKDNLYALRYDGTEWTSTFIAVLSGEDSPEWEGGEHANTAFLTARVSPNGRYLAFMTAANPTGYDNVDQTSGKRDEEVYLYDSSSASLTCVSCNPTGAPPAGVLDTVESSEGLGLLVDRRKIWLGRWLAGNIPGWTAENLVSALFQSRYLSDSGRLFFNSPDDLVPQATNHKEDVYEYEPAGVGGCESASGGCVALISSGTAANESAFLEATPSGNDVFFLTAAKLLPQDTDTAFDIYDARVCTQQSPCLTPPSPAPAGCTTADACRPASPPLQDPIGPSGSATFSGPGNLLQAPAPQHEVKGSKTSSKPLTNAQKLAKALKACRKQHRHSKKRRKACEAHARKLYGPKTKAKSSGGGSPKGRR